MPQLEQVNQSLLKAIQPEEVEVEIRRVEKASEGIEESELDEMWSYVSKKTNQRWLWHAIDRITGQVKRLYFRKREKMKSFSSSKSCCSHLALRNTVRMAGELMNVIYLKQNMR